MSRDRWDQLLTVGSRIVVRLSLTTNNKTQLADKTHKCGKRNSNKQNIAKGKARHAEAERLGKSDHPTLCNVRGQLSFFLFNYM